MKKIIPAHVRCVALVTLVVGVSSVALQSCEQDSELEDAAEEAGDALEEGAEELEEATD